MIKESKNVFITLSFALHSARCSDRRWNSSTQVPFQCMCAPGLHCDAGTFWKNSEKSEKDSQRAAAEIINSCDMEDVSHLPNFSIMSRCL